MKKATLFLFCVVLLVFSACGETPAGVGETPTGTEEVIQETKSTTPKEFCEKIEGIWVDAASAAEQSFSFLEISGESFRTGFYPGEYGRPGKIIEVAQSDEFRYMVTIHYEEKVMYEGDAPLPEKTVKCLFKITDEKDLALTSGGRKSEWTFRGKTLDEAAKANASAKKEKVPAKDEALEKNKTESDSGIPKVALKADIGYSLQSLKKQQGYSLAGPHDTFGGIMNNLFCTNEYAGLEYYFNNTLNEYYAVKDGEVVFVGLSGINGTGYVKDVIGRSNIDIEPAVYTAYSAMANGKRMDAYLWEMEKGYLSIIVMPVQGYEFYNMPLFTVAFVTDLEYLDYL